MKRDDVIRMAREAGLEEDDSLVLEPEVVWYIGLETLERFAALVATAAVEREREACIDIVAMHGGSVEIEAAIRARGKA